jgi:gp16 family phage-associated protein
MKSGDQVKTELADYGETVEGWARKHGFKPTIVRKVLNGELKNSRGLSHQIAVMLGMKAGKIRDA